MTREAAPGAALAPRSVCGVIEGSPAPPAQGPVILLYHSIQRVATDPFGVRVTPRNFRQHMQVVSESAAPLPLAKLESRLRDGSLPPRAVAVTFDDGYADNLSRALPAMERFGVPGTVFVSTGCIEQQREYWWDELDRVLLQPGVLPRTIVLGTASSGDGRQTWNLGGHASLGRWRAWRASRWRTWYEAAPTARHDAFRQMWAELVRMAPRVRDRALRALRDAGGVPSTPRSTHRPLTVVELRRLAASRLIEIGAHTVGHPSLAAMPEHHQHEEIASSKRWLEATIDRPVHSFSYPFGTKSDYNECTMACVRNAGFARSCSNFPAPITPATDPLQLPRRVVPDCSGKAFSRMLHSWLGK